MEEIIVVKNLKRNYRKYEKKEGFFESLKALFKRKYKEIRALRGISFKVRKGEILGIIGPNGAGKSTLIKILTGIMYPTSGEVDVMGYVPWKQREEYVKNIGVVFGGKSNLFWDLPAIDTFDLHKDIYEIPEEEWKKRVEKFTELLNVKDISKTTVRKLSLGERMKCELILAVLHYPKIIFLDEPTIGLDVVAKNKMRSFIKEVNKKYNVTFILTTHDMGDIEELCERIIIIDKGKIIYNGSLSKFKEKYMKSSIVKINFDEEIKEIPELEGCKVLKKEKYSIELEVFIRKTKISSVLREFFRNYEISDIHIEEPNIESLVRKVYESG